MVKFPESVLSYVQLQTNGLIHMYSSDHVFDLMDPYLTNLQPTKILELGSGVGRGSVYLFLHYKWNDTIFYLVDGNEGTVQKNGIFREGREDFYNSLNTTKEFCEANGLFNYQLIDCKTEAIPKIKFDLVFSILAFGFHWSVDQYLDIVDSDLLIFETRPLKKKYKEWINSEINKIESSKKYYLVSHSQKGKYAAIFVVGRK